MAASSDLKNVRAPAKKKFPTLPFLKQNFSLPLLLPVLPSASDAAAPVVVAPNDDEEEEEKDEVDKGIAALLLLPPPPPPSLCRKSCV